MKEFEKWWDDYPVGGTREDKEYALTGWKAALEWVLADLKAAREGFDLGLHDTINKELETE